MRPALLAVIPTAALACVLACSGAPKKPDGKPDDTGQTSGQTSGPASGPASDPTAGQTSGQTSGPAPGSFDPARDDAIELGTVDGARTRVGKVRAPVTIVAMWASFCAPCLRELHLIEALHQAYRKNPDVTVLLVSIDDFDAAERAKVAGIVADRSLTVPVFIDPERRLMERLAPRDAAGKAHYTVPMLVVLDARGGLRRLHTLDHQMGAAPFVDSVAPLVEAALRGDPPPADTPYAPPLGSGFTRRTITLTVPERLGEHQIVHYLDEFEGRLKEMYPELHDHQLADLMKEIEAKLRVGGTFKIEIPPGHAGAH